MYLELANGNARFVRIVHYLYLTMVNTGYKAMLRDRVPLVVNLALLWNNSKTAWVDHVYKNFISIYSSKLERDNATRIVLGIKKGNKGFDFHNGKSVEIPPHNRIKFTPNEKLREEILRKEIVNK